MYPQQNSQLQKNNENLQQTTTELQQLTSSLNGKPAFIQQKEAMLLRHLETVSNSSKSWVDRMLLPKEEKLMLKEYAEKQQDAIGIILANQNKSLAAICEGQVTFVKEVVNTLLKTGRAGMKAGADVLFMQFRNQRLAELQKLSEEFLNLIEIKMADAERRPSRLQEMKLREIDRDLQKWEDDYAKLQDEFSSILQEQV